MTYTEISTEILELLNLTSTTDTARIGRAINRKYREITSSLGIKHTSRRTTVQATFSIGISTLAFTSAEKIVNVFNRNVTPYKQLDEVTVDELEAMMPFNASDTPTLYAVKQIASDSVTILVNCIPQTAFALYADVYSTAATLSGTDKPVFSESYHDILISAVLVDEYMKLEKPSLSKVEYERAFGVDGNGGRLAQLRHSIAVSTTKQQYQGKTSGSSGSASGASGSGGTNGSLSYTQTGNIHFDRSGAGAGTDPFTVAAGSGKVDNLDADKLDGLDSTAFALSGAAPAAHKTTHQDGGSDEISVTGLNGLLADSQTPLAHSAALLTSGTVPDARFPATLPALSGVNLTALNASNLASGTVAPARLGSGSGGATKFLREDSTFQTVTTTATNLVRYTPTLANILNTASLTSFLSFSMPANEMADGDVLDILFAVLIKNNKGSVGTMEVDFVYGGTSVRVTDNAGGFAWSNTATERKWMFRITALRVGSDLWVFGPQGGGGGISLDSLNGVNPTTTYAGAVSSTPTFSSLATVELKGTLSAADANFYWKPQQAKIIRIGV